LAAQIVLVVEYIHTLGTVHGDLHLGNFLLKLPPDFDQISPEQLYEKYGAPEFDPVVRLDGNPLPLPPGVPSHGIMPIWLGKASEEISLPETRILLTDFGEAFAPSKETKSESRTPLVIQGGVGATARMAMASFALTLYFSPAYCAPRAQYYTSKSVKYLKQTHTWMLNTEVWVQSCYPSSRGAV
jgi:serine/threonine protein kinase